MNDFVHGNREKWLWTLMIMQPGFIHAEMVAEQLQQLIVKKSLPGLSHISFRSITEGLAAQTLHIGPFSEEGPTIQKLHEAIANSGNKLHGKHREIYLSDTRRTAPEKWRTIIRQPYRTA